MSKLDCESQSDGRTPESNRVAYITATSFMLRFFLNSSSYFSTCVYIYTHTYLSLGQRRSLIDTLQGQDGTRTFSATLCYPVAWCADHLSYCTCMYIEAKLEEGILWWSHDLRLLCSLVSCQHFFLYAVCVMHLRFHGEW
jgi:hypothetical protein